MSKNKNCFSNEIEIHYPHQNYYFKVIEKARLPLKNSFCYDFSIFDNKDVCFYIVAANKSIECNKSVAFLSPEIKHKFKMITHM